MKAYQIQTAAGIDGLKLVDLPEPKPGAGQILVRVRATSLNYRDTAVVSGMYPGQTLPVIPLSDGAGEVVAVGEGVTRVKVGNRVAGIFFQDWIAGKLTREKIKSALGGAINGMLAEYVVLSQEGVVLLPDHLSCEEGAALPCAAVTAWQALVTRGGLAAGETVLLLGTGGVSIFALQFFANVLRTLGVVNISILGFPLCLCRKMCAVNRCCTIWRCTMLSHMYFEDMANATLSSASGHCRTSRNLYSANPERGP